MLSRYKNHQINTADEQLHNVDKNFSMNQKRTNNIFQPKKKSRTNLETKLLVRTKKNYLKTKQNKDITEIEPTPSTSTGSNTNTNTIDSDSGRPRSVIDFGDELGTSVKKNTLPELRIRLVKRTKKRKVFPEATKLPRHIKSYTKNNNTKNYSFVPKQLQQQLLLIKHNTGVNPKSTLKKLESVSKISKLKQINKNEYENDETDDYPDHLEMKNNYFQNQINTRNNESENEFENTKNAEHDDSNMNENNEIDLNVLNNKNNTTPELEPVQEYDKSQFNQES